jgi:stage V sporulation protein G
LQNRTLSWHKGGEKQLRVTDVRIRKLNSEGKMRAVVSVTFDDEFVVHDIRVIEGQNGMFIAMPSRRTPDGQFKDIAHPINSETREIIQNAILDGYNEFLEKHSQEAE